MKVIWQAWGNRGALEAAGSTVSCSSKGSDGPPIPDQVMASECPEPPGARTHTHSHPPSPCPSPPLHARAQHPSEQWQGDTPSQGDTGPTLPALSGLENCPGYRSQPLHFKHQDKTGMVTQACNPSTGKTDGWEFKASLGYRMRPGLKNPATKRDQGYLCTFGPSLGDTGEPDSVRAEEAQVVLLWS